MSFQNASVGVDSATLTRTLHHILDQLDQIKADQDQIKANQFQLAEHLGLTLWSDPEPIQSAPAALPRPKTPQSRQDAPGSRAKPSRHRSPSQGKKLSEEVHFAILVGLHDHLLTTDLAGKFGEISCPNAPRIYIKPDNSYLYYTLQGNLVAKLDGVTEEACQNCEAQKAINDYGLNKQYWKPTSVNVEDIDWKDLKFERTT
jgi:hypothetical protein